MWNSTSDHEEGRNNTFLEVALFRFISVTTVSHMINTKKVGQQNEKR